MIRRIVGLGAQAIVAAIGVIGDAIDGLSGDSRGRLYENIAHLRQVISELQVENIRLRDELKALHSELVEEWERLQKVQEDSKIADADGGPPYDKGWL